MFGAREIVIPPTPSISGLNQSIACQSLIHPANIEGLEWVKFVRKQLRKRKKAREAWNFFCGS